MNGKKIVLTRITALVAAILAVLSATVHVAYAASTKLAPGYEEILTLAQERVEAASQPSAYGPGVPLIRDAMGMLPWLGLAIGLALAATIAAKVLVTRIRSDALVAQ
ncbi:MAG: hypothetical protein HRF40_02565 [Nitrososphaera sp.]|jgi:hypothetical protein